MAKKQLTERELILLDKLNSDMQIYGSLIEGINVYTGNSTTLIICNGYKKALASIESQIEKLTK